MTCAEAIRKVFDGEPRILTTGDVVDRIEAGFPSGRWKRSTISTTLIGLSPNHATSRHYPTLRRQGFLFSLGRGRYRLWDEATDGPLASTSDGVRSTSTRDRTLASAAPPVDPSAPPQAAPQDGTIRESLIRTLVDELHHDDNVLSASSPGPLSGAVRGWPARLRAYHWPFPAMDWRLTAEVLDPWFAEAGELSQRLLEGDAWSEAQRRRAAALAWQMLAWGGVARQRAFSLETVEAVFRRALRLPGGGAAPMNSGWTKVAALATGFLEGDPERAPHAIWDSRVSTSIVVRLDQMLGNGTANVSRRTFPGIGVVPGRGGTRLRPPPLQQSWARAYGSWAAQEAGSVLVRELRDLLNRGEYGWMPLPDGGEGPWTIRGVESVLFMDGY